VIERRARWERALACTRTELLLESGLALAMLSAGLAIRPRLSTILASLVGLAAGVVVHTSNRLVLGQPPIRRAVEWEKDPPATAPPRATTAVMFVAALNVVGVAVVYLATGTWKSLIAFFGGTFLAYAVIALAQRYFLERDFTHRFAGH
jgi:hypothetical protein